MFENPANIYYKAGLLHTVEKTMTQQKFCQDCDQRHDCQEVYQQLGKTKGPSVVCKVVVAFLLPMVVFIASLVVFDHILAKAINSKEVQTALSFSLALSITIVCIFVLRAINRQFSKDK